MSNNEVGDYTPIPGAGPRGPVGSPGAPGQSSELPHASVREVPAAASEPEEVRYHYVARPVAAAFHIWEEVTGERVSTAPVLGEHAADDLVRQLNRINSPPR